MLITIHADYTKEDVGYVSYREGLKLIKTNVSFTTHCLDFLNCYFDYDNVTDIVLVTRLGNEMSVKSLYSDHNEFTEKQIIPAHNISKIYRANGFNIDKKDY